MHLRHLLLPLAAIVALGCSSADEPDRIVSEPECRDGQGNVVACEVELPAAGSFSITLIGTSCDATNNVLRVTAPVSQTLLSNACDATIGQNWTIAAAANVQLGLQIESDDVGTFPPGLRITGTYPTWTASFEDGFDQDFNDIVVRIEAVVE